MVTAHQSALKVPVLVFFQKEYSKGVYWIIVWILFNKGHKTSLLAVVKVHCIQRAYQDITCYCSFCFGDVCTFCVVAPTSSAVCQMQHSSAQTLLLAHSFELHPLTTLSPVLQPWKLSHHTRSSKDTGYNTQSISVATSQCTPSSRYALYLRLKTHISIIVALLKPSVHVSSCFASPLMHKLWHSACRIFY